MCIQCRSAERDLLPLKTLMEAQEMILKKILMKSLMIRKMMAGPITQISGMLLASRDQMAGTTECVTGTEADLRSLALTLKREDTSMTESRNLRLIL